MRSAGTKAPGDDVGPVHRPVERVPRPGLAERQLSEQRHAERAVDAGPADARPLQDDQQGRREAGDTDQREIAVERWAPRAGAVASPTRSIVAAPRTSVSVIGASGRRAPRRVGDMKDALDRSPGQLEENVAGPDAGVRGRAARLDDRRRDPGSGLAPLDADPRLALRDPPAERRHGASRRGGSPRSDDGDDPCAPRSANHVFTLSPTTRPSEGQGQSRADALVLRDEAPRVGEIRRGFARRRPRRAPGGHQEDGTRHARRRTEPAPARSRAGPF